MEFQARPYGSEQTNDFLVGLLSLFRTVTYNWTVLRESRCKKAQKSIRLIYENVGSVREGRENNAAAEDIKE